MKVTLFDEASSWQNLLPLTYTRPICELRVGILTIRKKWEFELGTEMTSCLTAEYLQKKFTYVPGQLWINSSVCPDPWIVSSIRQLKDREALIFGDRLVAARVESGKFDPTHWNDLSAKVYDGKLLFIDRTWKIFRHVADEIRADFSRIIKNRISAQLEDPHTVVYGRENLFLEPGARVQASIIDATNGPVYLGKNSFVAAGSVIRGAFALGEDSAVNMGAKLRGDTSVGPGCKIGGEVSNSVFLGNCNKSHDGYLGNSVIGEWCNLGADTNCSNLKNNYANVKVWNYAQKSFIDTGLQFCGLTMGDHSKCGINTMFNTGTVVGVASNIFGAGFPRTFIPSFSWGGASGMTTYQFNKAIQTADLVMGRRKIPMDTTEKDILDHIFSVSSEFRVWEGAK
jgi:UDP-N-acetylglucosamine diphosphorylase/glucosamine-1-phosphate N-acetyltransferase